MASNKVPRHHGGMSPNGSIEDPMPSKAPARQSTEKFVLSVVPEPVDFRLEGHWMGWTSLWSRL